MSYVRPLRIQPPIGSCIDERRDRTSDSMTTVGERALRQSFNYRMHTEVTVVIRRIEALTVCVLFKPKNIIFYAPVSTTEMDDYRHPPCERLRTE
jgi:hypothetical protein